MAPEAIQGRRYSAASDCYSFAMLMIEVWTDGQIPFADRASLIDVALAVLNSDARPRIPDEMPLSQERLLRRLWLRNTAERPPMESGCLQLSAVEAPAHPRSALAATTALSIEYGAIE
jgi:hypothetical protein